MINKAIEVLKNEALAIENATKNLNEDFVKSVEILSNSNQIVISGVGKSGYIGKKVAATLNSYGFSAIFLDTVEALHGDIGVVSENATVIILSKSGTTQELITLLPFLKNRKCKIIGILGNTKSFLAEKCDYVINASVEKEACPFDLAPTSSTTLALAIGDALAVCMVQYLGKNTRDFSVNHPSGQLGRNTLLKISDVMKKNDAIPKITPNKSLIDAIVRMSDKGLGCVVIVEDDDSLLGILTDGDIRRLISKDIDFNSIKVKDVMTSDPVSISEDSYLGSALDLMENRTSQISVLPVTNKDNKLSGVVRIHDVYGGKES